MISPAAACIRFKLASSSGSWIWSIVEGSSQAATMKRGNWGTPTKNEPVSLLLKWSCLRPTRASQCTARTRNNTLAEVMRD